MVFFFFVTFFLCFYALRSPFHLEIRKNNKWFFFLHYCCLSFWAFKKLRTTIRMYFALSMNIHIQVYIKLKQKLYHKTMFEVEDFTTYRISFTFLSSYTVSSSLNSSQRDVIRNTICNFQEVSLNGGTMSFLFLYLNLLTEIWVWWLELKQPSWSIRWPWVWWNNRQVAWVFEGLLVQSHLKTGLPTSWL